MWILILRSGHPTEALHHSDHAVRLTKHLKGGPYAYDLVRLCRGLGEPVAAEAFDVHAGDEVRGRGVHGLPSDVFQLGASHLEIAVRGPSLCQYLDVLEVRRRDPTAGLDGMLLRMYDSRGVEKLLYHVELADDLRLGLGVRRFLFVHFAHHDSVALQEGRGSGLLHVRHAGEYHLDHSVTLRCVVVLGVGGEAPEHVPQGALLPRDLHAEVGAHGLHRVLDLVIYPGGGHLDVEIRPEVEVDRHRLTGHRTPEERHARPLLAVPLGRRGRTDAPLGGHPAPLAVGLLGGHERPVVGLDVYALEGQRVFAVAVSCDRRVP